jgi:hypothetical protein
MAVKARATKTKAMVVCLMAGLAKSCVLAEYIVW